MANLFLPKEDLTFLTGYKRPKDQRRWLIDHGWTFEVSADGKNRVLLEEARIRMLSKRPKRRSSSEPDLSVLRELR